MVRKLLLSLILSLWVVFFSGQNVSAQYQPVVQPSPVVSISIDKSVRNPQNNQYVDNLSGATATFLPGQEVNFRLMVRNNSSSEITNVSVRDKLPEFVDFVSGPGSYNQNTKEINFTIDRLAPGETKTYALVTKVQSTSKGGNIMSTCLTNFAEASANKMDVQDTSMFCIGEKVLGEVSELPRTGPISNVLVVVGSLGILATSIYLFRKAESR